MSPGMRQVGTVEMGDLVAQSVGGGAMKRKKITIYDTTLRDGTQGEGISLSLEDKLKIAMKIDSLGVDYIEAGGLVPIPRIWKF